MALPPDDPPPGVPEWVVTYGDMMSLLLTFFIMLVSMAEMKNEGKLRAAMDALQERFGPENSKVGAAPGPSLQTTGNMTKVSSESDRSQGGNKKGSAKSKGNAGKSQTVRRIAFGTAITLGGPCLFEKFSAELNDDLKADLEGLYEVLKKRPNRIVIRGHATREPLPPGSRHSDPMALSYARAEAVGAYLEELGLPSERLLVTAAGDSEPRVISRKREMQRENRRVDVLIVDAYTSQDSSVK
jgi:chemotaxis protein MotB